MSRLCILLIFRFRIQINISLRFGNKLLKTFEIRGFNYIFARDLNKYIV